MKLYYSILFTFILCLFSSFGPTRACEYAGSNVTYVKTETEKALAQTDLQLVRFHIYKALGAISKSQKQLDDCDCEDASEHIAVGSEILTKATKTTSLTGTRVLLERALQNIQEGLDALHDHNGHTSPYGNDDLAVNAPAKEQQQKLPSPPSERMFQQKIDSSLTRYRTSLQKTIATVDCKEARAFANRIYEHCELQLLRPDLSEGKKYYNLRTKEITGEALDALGDCGK